MLVLARICGYLFHLGRGDVLRENPADTPALRMHFEHDLGSAFPREREEDLEYLDHEFHWSVIVVVHDDLEHRGRLGLLLARLEDCRSGGFVGHVALERGNAGKRDACSLIWTAPGGFSRPFNPLAAPRPTPSGTAAPRFGPFCPS